MFRILYQDPLNVLSLTNDAYYMKQVSFVDPLSVILYDGDLDEPDSNSLCFVLFVNFQGESLAEHQAVIVASGPHEASVMRSVARAPTFIQLESEDVLTGVERVAWFWGVWAVLNGGQSCARHPFRSVAGGGRAIIILISGSKPDKLRAV